MLTVNYFSPQSAHTCFLGVLHFAGAYTLEAVLLPCSLCYVFAGLHTLPQLRRGLSQTDAKLLRCASCQPTVCVKDEPVMLQLHYKTSWDQKFAFAT